MRRSRRFDQVLDESELGIQSNHENLDDLCAPIQCDDDDDGPDFTRMSKKTAKGQGSVVASQVSQSRAKKGDDIRKRFMIEKHKGTTVGMMGSQQ